MKTYRIQANAIDTTYEGNSEEEALENYAKDAGYSSYNDLVSQHGEVDSIQEIMDSYLQQKNDFINKHHVSITKEFHEHRDKTGYLRLMVDENFNLMGGIDFVEDDFNRDEFVRLNKSGTPHPETVKEADFMYWEVLWVADKTKHRFKELALLHKTDNYELFNKPSEK